MRLATTACYRACTATELADATETTTTTATTATTHATEIALRRLQRTATELADAKTTATEHYSCLIGVGACAQILISEPEREALTQICCLCIHFVASANVFSNCYPIQSCSCACSCSCNYGTQGHIGFLSPCSCCIGVLSPCSAISRILLRPLDRAQG